MHVKDLYSAEELKRSPTYNELLLRAGQQDSLNVRLDGADGSHITWGLGDPVDSDGWGSARIAMVTGLLPHIRQFVRVRQALVRAEARSTTVTALLDNPRIGVLQLDQRGGITEVNDRARGILRRGDGLSDRGGMLRARAPADQVRLERLLGDALPASGAAAVSGSMLLRRSPVSPPFVVHVKPVGVPRPDYGARHVAALVLIVEPGRRHRVDPDLVATTLQLTPAETQVAVWLTEGKSVRDLRRRLSDHGSSSVTRATLTVKMARIAAGKGTNYKTDRKAQTLYDEDSTFRTEFDKARARIRAMQVRYVKEDDDVRQALLEIYAAVKLDTIYNSFKTS